MSDTSHPHKEARAQKYFRFFYILLLGNYLGCEISDNWSAVRNKIILRHYLTIQKLSIIYKICQSKKT